MNPYRIYIKKITMSETPSGDRSRLDEFLPFPLGIYLDIFAEVRSASSHQASLRITSLRGRLFE